jgi:hypothetical protein
MSLTPNQLEAMLVENIRSYLADYKTSDEVEALRLRELCETLNWFFLALVREHEKWSRFHSVDGVVALSVELRSVKELALDGYIFVFGEKRTGGFMMEPFSATLRIKEAGDRLGAYRILCGDANRAFGTIQYSVSRSPRQTMSPDAWLFTLESEEN